MRILLLGNGFDLNYKLPTSYVNFLHTVSFLVNHYDESIKNVGDIFGNEELLTNDKVIRESYEKYEKLYKSIELDSEIIRKLIDGGKNNIWFTYFLNSINKDITWIDFEQEINTVISGFKDYLANPQLVFSTDRFPENKFSRFVIQCFNFFLNTVAGKNTYKVKDEYVYEYPLHSKIHCCNNELIVEKLIDELDKLSQMLQLYLSQFVETVVNLLANESWQNEWFIRLNPDYVVTFNYTNTFEKFSPGSKVLHIHGVINNKIVLGVNPNEDDEIDTADTTFLPFKKYFQRVVYGTDSEYLALLDMINEPVSLTVMGHSLDITDKDIITELFKYADDITVMNHSPNALASHISKLVEIYGKDGFDLLRTRKKLNFISLITDMEKFYDKISYEDFSAAFK